MFLRGTDIKTYDDCIADLAELKYLMENFLSRYITENKFHAYDINKFSKWLEEDRVITIERNQQRFRINIENPFDGIYTGRKYLRFYCVRREDGESSNIANSVTLEISMTVESISELIGFIIGETINGTITSYANGLSLTGEKFLLNKDALRQLGLDKK